MKQILYFLIGFTISLTWLTFGYCGVPCDEVPGDVESGLNCDVCNWVGSNISYAANSTEAMNACNAAMGGDCNNSSMSSSDGDYYMAYKSVQQSGLDFIYYAWVAMPDGCVEPDSDGDGISNEFDLYPDDPTPYQYTVISEVLDADGNPVAIKVKTDRDDIFDFGERPEDMEGYIDYIHIAPVLQDAETLESLPIFTSGTAGSESTSVSLSDYSEEIETYVNQETDAGSGSDFESSETSTGTETDSEALQKIINNTASTTENLSRLGDYLQSINSNIAELNRRDEMETALTGDLLGQDSGSLTSADVQQGVEDALNVTDSEKDSAISTMGNVDTEYNEAQSTITGTASLEEDAPDEYKTKTNITSKMADYISNNPISAIIENSGVTISGAVDHVSWMYKDTEIFMSVGQYDAALEAFGQLLVGMATLSGMLLIFRGF